MKSIGFERRQRQNSRGLLKSSICETGRKGDVSSLNMGHKGHYQRILTKNNVTQDSRSQSLPSCVVEEKLNGISLPSTPIFVHDRTEQWVENGNELLEKGDNSPSGSGPDNWFRTWPERCNDKMSETQKNGTQRLKNNNIDNKPHCDNLVENSSPIKTKLTLDEALQNISLAYSPITKQLHVVQQPLAIVETNHTTICNESKKGHKRSDKGSFSSTISSLTDPSPSGSLLGADERSLSSVDIDSTNGPVRKKSLTNFFSRGILSSWKSTSGSSNGVWKFFSTKSPADGSPGSPHHVASSSALILHPRPSNLPAKTQEEEQRHRDEYEAMVAAAKKKDALTTVAKLKQQKLQLQLEEQQANSTKHFTKNVLTNWDQMHATKKTRDLWWQGLPSSVRGKIWRLAIGNELNVTSQLYEICLQRAQNRLGISSRPSSSEGNYEASLDAIQLDISRTFPHLCIFQQGGPYSEMLHSLLAAYVCYRPDIGYVQGMSYIGAILILNMEPLDAFVCFANLLNQPLHLSAFTLNQEQMESYYMAYDEVFCYNLPKLHGHFESSRLTPDLYLLDWIYTIFAKAMPLDVACRVWDIFLRDGFEFIFRTALGILHLNQDLLLDMDFLHGSQFLTRLPDDLSSDQLFKSIQIVTTTVGKLNFSQIVEKYSV